MIAIQPETRRLTVSMMRYLKEIGENEMASLSINAPVFKFRLASAMLHLASTEYFEALFLFETTQNG